MKELIVELYHIVENSSNSYRPYFNIKAKFDHGFSSSFHTSLEIPSSNCLLQT